MVYDVTNVNSISNVMRWMETTGQYMKDYYGMVLVANKMDQRN